jgi:hypothetical protein
MVVAEWRSGGALAAEPANLGRIFSVGTHRSGCRLRDMTDPGQYGHTFTRHSSTRTLRQMQNRAASTGNPQGQWLVSDEEVRVTVPGGGESTRLAIASSFPIE